MLICTSTRQCDAHRDGLYYAARDDEGCEFCGDNPGENTEEVHVVGDCHEAMKIAESLLRTLTPDAQRYVHDFILASDTRENPISSCFLGAFRRQGFDVEFEP